MKQNASWTSESVFHRLLWLGVWFSLSLGHKDSARRIFSSSLQHSEGKLQRQSKNKNFFTKKEKFSKKYLFLTRTFALTHNCAFEKKRKSGPLRPAFIFYKKWNQDRIFGIFFAKVFAQIYFLATKNFFVGFWIIFLFFDFRVFIQIFCKMFLFLGNNVQS